MFDPSGFSALIYFLLACLFIPAVFFREGSAEVFNQDDASSKKPADSYGAGVVTFLPAIYTILAVWVLPAWLGRSAHEFLRGQRGQEALMRSSTLEHTSRTLLSVNRLTNITPRGLHISGPMVCLGLYVLRILTTWQDARMRRAMGYQRALSQFWMQEASVAF